MKKLLILLSLLSLLSCKKDNINQINQTNQQQNQNYYNYQIINGKWLIIEGYMYLENIETHQKIYYTHFDQYKSTSSLRYSGPIYEIDYIIKDTTTWEFITPNSIPNYGEFILNNDTINLYGLYVTNSNISIVEHPLTSPNGPIYQKMGGSAIPIIIENYDDINQILFLTIQGPYENINGYNYKTFNVLKFKKI